MNLENFGGASTLLGIDFLKLWGGQCPPGPPGSAGPAITIQGPPKNGSYF